MNKSELEEAYADALNEWATVEGNLKICIEALEEIQDTYTNSKLSMEYLKETIESALHNISH